MRADPNLKTKFIMDFLLRFERSVTGKHGKTLMSKEQL